MIGEQSTLSAKLFVIDQGKNVDVSPGHKEPGLPIRISGGKVKATSAGQIQVDVTGGVPPISISVKERLAGPRGLGSPAIGVTTHAGPPWTCQSARADATKSWPYRAGSVCRRRFRMPGLLGMA